MREVPGGVARVRAALAALVGAALATTSLAASAAAAVGAAVSPAEPPDGPRTLTREAAEARWADAASRFADVGGIRVHYKDEGAGPAVLLVHGSYGDLADWDGWATALRERWRVIRFDRPGAGLTGPVPNGNYSLDRQLALVDDLMDTLGVERFAIVGASLGGPVAFRYAATRRDRVAALVLMNSAGIEFGGRQGTTRAPPVESYGWIAAPAMTRADVRKTFAGILNDPAKVTDAFIERKFQLHGIVGREQEAIATIRQYERGTPERVLARVRAPSLVLWGSGNRALSTQTADAFADALANAPVVEKIVYEGAGHMLHVERPERTVADAEAFLARYARAPAPPFDALAAHWSQAAGTWVAEAGYLDGQLVPNVARYGALLQVAIEGRSVAQTEWKFYPSSPLATQIARSLTGTTLRDGEGLALVSAQHGRPGAGGALEFGPEGGEFVAAGAGSSVGTVIAGESRGVRYRMLHTFPAADRMVRTTLGFDAAGALQGVSVFRFRRIDAADFAMERAWLETEYRVAVEIDRTGIEPVLRRRSP